MSDTQIPRNHWRIFKLFHEILWTNPNVRFDVTIFNMHFFVNVFPLYTTKNTSHILKFSNKSCMLSEVENVVAINTMFVNSWTMIWCLWTYRTYIQCIKLFKTKRSILFNFKNITHYSEIIGIPFSNAHESTSSYVHSKLS